jgi:protein-S-isoprenylcysteine O-methyltransferase Ste14
VALLAAVASGALFAWAVRTVRCGRLTAAFSSDLRLELIDDGPFHWLRHPFYGAYLLSYLHVQLASRSAWTLLPLCWMAAMHFSAAHTEKAKFMASPLASAYRAPSRNRQHGGGESSVRFRNTGTSEQMDQSRSPS